MGSIAGTLTALVVLIAITAPPSSSQGPPDPNDSGFIGFIVNGGARPDPQRQRSQFQFHQFGRAETFDEDEGGSDLGPNDFRGTSPRERLPEPSLSTPAQFGETGGSQRFSEAPPQRFRPEKSSRASMTESCLACICQASTNCNLTTRCVSGGQYCGPFLISRPYWLDAGSPTLFGDAADRDGAFADCAVDPICSAQTVRNYMNKFKKDCNGDGLVDCEDLARIHLMGPFGTECGSSAVPATGFYTKFRSCWNTVLEVSS